MKKITWDSEKNFWLLRNRNISFEEILMHLANGKLLDEIKHPNESVYKNQKILIININNYAYCVPFEETNAEIIFKTIFPSRKYTKKFLKGATNE